MGFQDAMTYVLFTNPVSSNALQIAKAAANGTADYIGLKPKTVEVVQMPQEPLWKLVRSSGPFMQIAAISGASGVILGAYGSHKEGLEPEQKRVFEVASRYHLIHSLALLGAPLCRKPYLVSGFITSGLVLFCGTTYYFAFTGDKTYSKLTPIGGTCFILGWLSMFI